MEKTIKIRSSFLSVLNEALQKLTLNDTVKTFTPVIIEADGKFTSVVKTEDEFDPSVFGANIDTEENKTENDIAKKETKDQLINKAKDAIQQTVDSSSNLKDILNKINELSKTEDGKWKLNKEHNTASLASRNTYIFKQNNNLCVSHHGKIELFKSVDELRNWLKANHYPLPDDTIVIHESVEVDEAKEGRNWVDLYNAYKEKQKTDYQSLPSTKPETNDDYASLSKRIPKEIYQADAHKKQEPKISTKYLDFADDDINECFGGITTVSSLGSAVQYTGNKKKEEKEDLDEAINEDFPDFAPQAANDPSLPVRGQGGKKAEAFVNSLLKHPETIEMLKNGEFKELPFTKNDYYNVLQSIYYQYSGTHVGNSNWPKKVKQVLQYEASDLLNKFEKEELGPVETQIVATFVQIISESGTEITNEKLIDGLALALDDIFRKNEPQFTEFNQKLASVLTQELNKDFGEIKVEIKPGDTLLYGKTAVEQDDINNPENKQILYKLNKHIGNNSENDDDVGNIQARKQWNIENFKVYMDKKKILDVFKKLYDAVYNPNSKAKFSDSNDAGVDKWLSKNKENMISLLTDNEINEIKASWNQAKAEIKQEQPTIEPKPAQIGAEIKQDDALTGKETQILDMLLKMNPDLDLSKYSNDQLREKINKAMMLFSESKKESIYESAMKHPWLNKVLNLKLTEADSPADFATGSPISSDMDAASATPDTSSADSTPDLGGISDIPMDNSTPDATSNGFGDVDISVNGYDPEEEGNDAEMMAQNAPEYKIIDVLANTDDPTDIKVKLKNTESGEIEIKDLSEI